MLYLYKYCYLEATKQLYAESETVTHIVFTEPSKMNSMTLYIMSSCPHWAVVLRRLAGASVHLSPDMHELQAAGVDVVVGERASDFPTFIGRRVPCFAMSRDGKGTLFFGAQNVFGALSAVFLHLPVRAEHGPVKRDDDDEQTTPAPPAPQRCATIPLDDAAKSSTATAHRAAMAHILEEDKAFAVPAIAMGSRVTKTLH